MFIQMREKALTQVDVALTHHRIGHGKIRAG